MRWFHWFAPLLGLALAAADAPAQGVVIINPYISGTSFTYTRVGRHSAFSISAGTFGPYGYGYGYGYGSFGPWSRYYSYSSSVNIIVPPVIVVPRDSLYAPDDDLRRDRPARRDLDRDLDVAPMEKLPLPGRDAGDFRPLDPDNRKRAEQPILPDVPPMKKPDLPPPEDKMPPPLPRPPQPENDPVAESARLIGLGKTAFAEQEYGRAAERFLQASKLTPKDAMVHFLHAQALLALGKYLDAVDEINIGLPLQPDWPLKHFQPLELCGQHVAAYPEHLRRLEDTLTKHPNDAALLFLFAYQLWFDGRKDEARALFQKARPGVPDPTLVDRFLQAKPAAPPVAGGGAARNWL
jgi:tetratricopeptide (TPR) repeat protein